MLCGHATHAGSGYAPDAGAVQSPVSEGSGPLAARRATALRRLLLPGVLTNDSSLVRTGGPPSSAAPPQQRPTGLLARLGESARRLQMGAGGQAAAPSAAAGFSLPPLPHSAGAPGSATAGGAAAGSRRHLPRISEVGGGPPEPGIDGARGSPENGAAAAGTLGDATSASAPTPPPPGRPEPGQSGGGSRAVDGAAASKAPAEAAPAPMAPAQQPSASTSTWAMSGDPTEGALLTLAVKAGVTDLKATAAAHPRLGSVPFDSEYKFQATMHDVAADGDPAHDAGRGGADGRRRHRRFVFVKGAWDRLIARCATQACGDGVDDPFAPGEPIDREAWVAAATEYARHGLRVLALAQFEVPADTATLSVDDILGGEPRLQMNCVRGGVVLVAGASRRRRSRVRVDACTRARLLANAHWAASLRRRRRATALAPLERLLLGPPRRSWPLWTLRVQRLPLPSPSASSRASS